MPSVPILIPSLTPTVLNRMPTSPWACTDFLAANPKSSRCMLHGLPSNQTLAIPTWALCMSSGVRPVA